MVHSYFSYIAYDIVNIFKRALTEKCRNTSIEVLRWDILHKIAIIYFKGKSLCLNSIGKRSSPNTKGKYGLFVVQISRLRGLFTTLRKL